MVLTKGEVFPWDCLPLLGLGGKTRIGARVGGFPKGGALGWGEVASPTLWRALTHRLIHSEAKVTGLGLMTWEIPPQLLEVLPRN